MTSSRLNPRRTNLRYSPKLLKKLGVEPFSEDYFTIAELVSAGANDGLVAAVIELGTTPPFEYIEVPRIPRSLNTLLFETRPMNLPQAYTLLPGEAVCSAFHQDVAKSSHGFHQDLTVLLRSLQEITQESEACTEPAHT